MNEANEYDTSMSRPVLLKHIKSKANVSNDIIPDDGGADAVEEEEEEDAPAKTTLPLLPAAAAAAVPR